MHYTFSSLCCTSNFEIKLLLDISNYQIFKKLHGEICMIVVSWGPEEQASLL